MKDVAKHAGVSVATVSNVITNKKHVSPSVRKEVEDAIAELGYTINLVARGLKLKKTFSVGVVLPDITKIFFPDVLKGIQDAALEKEYSINFFSSYYDFNKEVSYVTELKSNRADGIIIDTCCNVAEVHSWAKELLTGIGGTVPFPVVSIVQAMDTRIVSSVTIDYRLATRRSVDYLLSIGRRRILYIAAPRDLTQGQERLEGYREALESAGITVTEDLILYCGFSIEKAYEGMREVLASGIPVDAVLSANDQMAIAALKALDECGFDVPRDVAVLGFNNLFPCTLVQPKLSSVYVPRYEMGFQAFRMLERLIEDPKDGPFRLVLDTNIIERHSTNAAKKGEWSLFGW